ncbi:putative cytochrome P450 [Aspergillus brunneoviolaceus CBS 621.78]|uniref:Cytochrome P450 n=1 Tax=Aspergillus brunneoviolaceus CBS 621.78 TaxID=1450534 RepID=A0ACD1G664_9EURO|nr:cytochrome P450 [Aspergillus brunneoviolaceus CBS 621.78]RAH44658.1 cytochrome P450 [Aspergillus brunneoviolaceus CBS 621.78]
MLFSIIMTKMGVASLGSVLLLLLCCWLCVHRLRAKSESQESIRHNVVLVEPSSYILRVVDQLQYLLKGPEIVQKAHIKNSPYAVRTPEGYQVQFSSREHIKQLVQAPDTYLSLHALAKDMFQPKYTMNGLEYDDCMSANGTVHQRALQAELRSHLPALTQPLHDCIVQALAAEITAHKPQSGEWRAVPIFPMAKRLITAANALVFFGPEVSSDQVFLDAALEYPEHLMETAEALRLLPAWVAPFAAPYLMRRHRALKILLDRLTPVVEARIRKTSTTTTTTTAPEHADCIQFFVNAAARKNQQHEWPAQRIIQVLLGVWFASVHQPAMCLFYALDDLCLHPEFTSALRDEVVHAAMPQPTTITTTTTTTQQSEINPNHLPLLTSFLKESARLHPTDSISLRRKVLQPFTLADGTTLAKNDVACIPLQPILRDPDLYADPHTFNPYRFIIPQDPEKVNEGTRNPTTRTTSSDFTDADVTFPIWGLGKRACPGRYYASLLLKLVLAQILLRYEVKMVETAKDERRYFYWRSAIVPKAGAGLLFRERGVRALAGVC